MSASELSTLSDERLQDLLVKSSRTFALAIPQLPTSLRREVTIAYLLFRIADTFEDATGRWGKDRQLEALSDFVELLASPSPDGAGRFTAGWLHEPPTDHAGYLELLGATPEVIGSWAKLLPAAARSIVRHTRRTAQLMSAFVERTNSQGVLQLEGMDDLRQYCYAVAGIVGEMLTDLFVLDSPGLERVRPELSGRAAAFGEGLQLVNILKDSAGDAVEGRNFLPGSVDRSEVFALARRDLEQAAEYCLTLQEAGGDDGVVAFVALPVELAWATLDRVEKKGPGAKISRHTVFTLHGRVKRAIRERRPVLVAGRPRRVGASGGSGT